MNGVVVANWSLAPFRFQFQISGENRGASFRTGEIWGGKKCCERTRGEELVGDVGQTRSVIGGRKTHVVLNSTTLSEAEAHGCNANENEVKGGLQSRQRQVLCKDGHTPRGQKIKCEQDCFPPAIFGAVLCGSLQVACDLPGQS